MHFSKIWYLKTPPGFFFKVLLTKWTAWNCVYNSGMDTKLIVNTNCLCSCEIPERWFAPDEQVQYCSPMAVPSNWIKPSCSPKTLIECPLLHPGELSHTHSNTRKTVARYKLVKVHNYFNIVAPEDSGGLYFVSKWLKLYLFLRLIGN